MSSRLEHLQPISEEKFIANVSKACFSAVLDCWGKAWGAGSDQNQDKGKSSGDGMGAFLAPLEAPLAMMQKQINLALMDDIYKATHHK
jgi:hypothetical protein